MSVYGREVLIKDFQKKDVPVIKDVELAKRLICKFSQTPVAIDIDNKIEYYVLPKENDKTRKEIVNLIREYLRNE